MIIEIRKVVSAPLIKKGIEEVCKETGMSATEYAYGLVVADINKRNSNKNISALLANEVLNPKTFLAEVCRVVEKYDKLVSAK